MRLTLRTMLAYLDDVLDPADAQELEHKIEESSFASGLVHRVRDSMRRMRLGAPKLDGRGLGLDPNTVADYLDSTLAPERVPEFEKVCLESDVHLAEVASCHQILTLVLGEPAQVDTAMRERAYRIGRPENRQAKATTNAAGNGSTAHGSAAKSSPGTGVAVSPARAQRPSQSSAKSLAITVLLAFLIAIVAFQAIGVDKLRGLIGLSSREVVETPLRESAETAEPVVSIPSGDEPLSPESIRSNATTRPDSAVPELSSAEVARPTELPVDSQPVVADDAPVVPSPEVMNDAEATVVSRPVEEGGELPRTSDGSPPASDSVGVVVDSSSPIGGGKGTVAAVEPEKQVPVGRYISEEQVLARFDTVAGDWFRMEPDSPLLTDQRVIALPTYRPQLVLSPNIKVTLAGESHLRFGQTKEEAAPVVRIESGRAVIVPLGKPESSLHLEAVDRRAVISFADADSVLAVDVMKYLPPGQQPELEPAASIIQVFALSGHVSWQEVGVGEFVIGAGQVLVIGGETAPALFEAGELPGWVDGKDLADIDRIASSELRADLTTDRPLSLSLLERTEHRRVEVRSLACRSLCALDMFDAAIKALDGPGLRSYWYAQFDALRGAMSRNSEAAVKLQRSLEKLTSDDAGLMYELLCGFSPDQLSAGGAKELVDALEHERVSTRVLAYENLRRITDKTQLFRPEQPPTQQKGEVMKWRRNLEAGAIVYLHPPQALPARTAVIADARGDSPTTE
ncbi:MAG: hypothetical protein H6823_15760 [Planctomycetaceae bacterium]|nr:hypothetical protein [Planctomycetales bacterium]MCB9939696.1 hypothetical protein [Planctomycetaceae bacterium]